MTAPGCPFHTQGPISPTGCPVSAQAQAFDPFGEGYLQNPPDYLAWSRAQEPVFWAPQIGHWVVTRYDDVKAVFRDNVSFSPRIALDKITPTGPEANAVLQQYGYAMNRTLVNEDEPAHMARRRLLMEPFSPAALQHHIPLVRRLADDYIDRFIDDGRADLVNQMLWEVPLTIALHFLGVPEEDMPLLRQYSIAHTVNTWGRPKPEQQVAVAHAVGNFWQLAGRVLDKMRANPDAPGWMPFGIRMQQAHPDIVTDSYLHSMMMAGIVAAHETTAHASANALKRLLSRPDDWQRLCDEPALIPNAVEECLRLEGSIIAWRRLALRAVTIGGVTIPEGARLLIVMASANHDERHFTDADALDLLRDNAAEHLSFGYGAHQCLGKNLARLEMQVFLDAFTRRLPHLQLAPQDFSYLPNTSFRGPEHLWVQWDPARNPERQDPAIRHTPRLQPRLGEPPRASITRAVSVTAAEPLAEGVLGLTLASADGRPLPRWTAGAHIDIGCGSEPPAAGSGAADAAGGGGDAAGVAGPAGTSGSRPGSRPRSRQYSLHGDPDDRLHYRVAVLREPPEAGGRGGSDWLHRHARVGATLTIRGPRNHFRLDEGAQRLLLIAGGIGITPIAAMAARAQALGIPYTLHYAGRSRRTMALLPALQARHAERLQLHAADEGGRADLAALLAAVPADERAGTAVYACGPARLLQALQALVTPAAGWPEDALHTEHFQAQAPGRDARLEHGFTLELRNAGQTLAVPPGRTVLSVLQAAGLDIPCDCQEGLCGSCEVGVLAGDIDHRDRVLTRGERAEGRRMMACCSRAAGERLVLDL